MCKNVEIAQEMFEILCKHARDIWETIEVYIHRNQFYICLERYDDLVNSGFECLETLGLHVERHPTPAMLEEARAAIYHLLGSRKVSDLIDNAAAVDPRARVCFQCFLFPYLIA